MVSLGGRQAKHCRCIQKTDDEAEGPTALTGLAGRQGQAMSQGPTPLVLTTACGIFSFRVKESESQSGKGDLPELYTSSNRENQDSNPALSNHKVILFQ